MGWVNVPFTYWIALQFENYGILYQNSVYFDTNGVTQTRPQAVAIIAAVKEWYTGGVLPILASDHKLVGIAAINITTELSFTEFELYGSGFGGSAGDGMPFNLAFQIWFETGVAGLSGIGHNNVSGIPRNVVSGPVVNEAFASGLRDAYENLIGVAASVDCTWVVCSRHTGGADRPEGVNNPVTSVQYKGLDVSTWRQRQLARHS